MNKKGFISSFGRVIDLGSTINVNNKNIPDSLIISDSESLKRDWVAVGNDLRKATLNYEERKCIQRISY